MHWAEKGALIDFNHLSLGLKSFLYLASAGTDFLSHVARMVEFKTYRILFILLSLQYHIGFINLLINTAY